MHIISPYIDALPIGAVSSKRHASPKTAISNMGWAIIIFVIVLLLYAMQAHGSIAQGYKIRDTEERIQALETEQRDLRLALSQLRAVHRLEAFAEAEGLTGIGRVSYLALEPIYVAESGSRHETIQ